MNYPEDIGTDEAWVQSVHTGLVRELASLCRPYGDQMIADGSMPVTYLTRSRRMEHLVCRCLMPGVMFQGSTYWPGETQIRDPGRVRRVRMNRVLATVGTKTHLWVRWTPLVYGAETDILFTAGGGRVIDVQTLDVSVPADSVIRCSITDAAKNTTMEDSEVHILLASDFRAS